MVVSRDGRILYVSESIANYLGLRQVGLSEGEGRGEARLGGRRGKVTGEGNKERGKGNKMRGRETR